MEQMTQLQVQETEMIAKREFNHKNITLSVRNVFFLQFRVFTCCVNLSWHAIRILAALAGEIKLKLSSTPSSRRAALMASLMANRIDDAKNNGGSPTAFDE